MFGYSTWPLRDIIIAVALIFNAGGLVYLARNYPKRVSEQLKLILAKLNDIEQRVAFLEGKLNDGH